MAVKIIIAHDSFQHLMVVACKTCPEVLYKQAKVALDSLWKCVQANMQTAFECLRWNDTMPSPDPYIIFEHSNQSLIDDIRSDMTFTMIWRTSLFWLAPCRIGHEENHSITLMSNYMSWLDIVKWVEQLLLRKGILESKILFHGRLLDKLMCQFEILNLL